MPTSEWVGSVRNVAKKRLAYLLAGIGDGSWEVPEEGEKAFHLRRRLTPEEMGMLHGKHPACPVFTHGKALEVMQK